MSRANSKKVSAPLAGMKPIENVLHSIIGTAFVIGSIPVSCMLVAPSGGGKSRTLIGFDADYIFRADDLTSSGLFDILSGDPENRIKYILIPDFNPILSHKASVSQLLVANLLSVTQDGTVRIVDGRQKKEVKHAPVGILTAVTFDMYARYSRRWHELGIARRILPIHYVYSLPTIREAQYLIRHGRITSEIPPLKLYEYKQADIKIPKNIALEIESLSKQLSVNLGQVVRLVRGSREAVPGQALYPMAPQIVLTSVAKGSAIRFGRNYANQTDLAMCVEFVSFTDMVNRRQL